MKKHLKNIFRLGVKEFQTLWHDKVMVILIAYIFSFAIYIDATSTSVEIHNASITFVDQDRSSLSARVIDAFYPPRFKIAGIVSQEKADKGMDAGDYTFSIVIPSGFEKKIISGKTANLQLNIDATRMTQAGVGAGYIEQIIEKEVSAFLQKPAIELPINLITRMKYNPNSESTWFGSVMAIINYISMLSIMLAGAALIREREHGTLEHLMVLPINATEIMLAKIWSMGLVVLVAVIFALEFIVQGVLSVPISGSIPLFLLGTILILFATTSMGIFMGTVAKTMPQFGLIFIMTIIPIMILSGTLTPFESMPQALQYLMYLVPTSHFVSFAQAVLYRGAGINIVWIDMLWIFLIGMTFFLLTLTLFRKSLESE